ncbi:porphobilinogen synthase [Thermogutta sp.]|uniref:porphobilinogen synthase n=1 Tax=Thermogutta sp. TaxID=1962930 RepID=UPI003C7EAC18
MGATPARRLIIERCRAVGFPTVRMRRLRYHPGIRQLVQAVRLDPGRWILPLFVHARSEHRVPISSMPGHDQLSLEALREEIEEVKRLGLGGVLLFGIPDHKDPLGSDATSEQGIICRAIRVIKEIAPELLVITDECFCEYTSHGHCGALGKAGPYDTVDNDQTLRMLGWQAVAHARAGADMVAPSGMMDGMVGAIRQALDQAGYTHVPIMSYSAKYASAFYGPFREAAESAPQFGDRRSYQMDPAAAAEQALREVELDLAEGADIIMVKPATSYLDIIRLVKEQFPGVPVAAYNVSGEYSMVWAAAEKGWLDLQRVALEMLTAIHRAGADIIITYWAKQAVKWLEQ